MKLTAALIMLVNTKDCYQVSSEKDKVHLMKDLEYNFLGKVAISPSIGQQGPITSADTTLMN